MKELIASKGFMSLGLVALVTLASNGLPLKAQQKQAGSRPSRQTISSLPNGNYFYGTSRNPYQSGADYLIFRKTGRTIIGMKYPVPGETTCFKGTASSNGITNVIIYLQALGEESRSGEFRPRNPINLNSYYRLRVDSAPNFAKRGRDQCMRVFSNLR